MGRQDVEFYWVRRLSDDRVIDIPASHLERTLARGGFELMSGDPVKRGNLQPKRVSRDFLEELCHPQK